MLSLQECLDFCDLEHDEIEAIAEHEHIPVIVAAELGCALLKTEEGVRHLDLMLRENAGRAAERGQADRAEHMAQVYRHFHDAHRSAAS